MRRKEKGFSLIELLIVVAIILIIAAIAIPNLLRSRMAANESSAVGSLRTMNTAAVTYQSTWGNGFPPNLAAFAPPAAPPATCDTADLLDRILACAAMPCPKSGYNFTYAVVASLPTAPPGCAVAGGVTYDTTGTPINVGTTGQRAFSSSEGGVIYFDATGTAPARNAGTPIS